MSQQSVCDWNRKLKRKGAQGLGRAGRAGRRPRLGAAQKAELRRALVQGAEALGYPTPLWTLDRVAELIERCTEVRFHRSHVARILHGLGWSCQRPSTRAACASPGEGARRCRTGPA